MKISVIGTGYVGLVSGVGLANAGHHVTCIDVREDIVERLSRGEATIYEEGLEEALASAIAAGRLDFTLPDTDRMADADVILVAVGTPSKDGKINLEFVESAARLAGEAVGKATRPISVIMKSTVVPGTTRGVLASTVQEVSGRDRSGFGIGMNPEFLREGSAIGDFTFPDRIVLGADDEIAQAHLEEMYASFDVPKHRVSSATAELTKYANNMLLALQISAANEIANVATALGDVDPLQVMQGVVADARWGGQTPPGIASYLKPGPGFGGSCFPKDVEALRTFGQELGLPMHVSESILSVNGEQPRRAVTTMLEGIELKGAKVAVLGLAFKPDTDDVRLTPALPIVNELVAAGAEITAYDPLGIEHFKALTDAPITYAGSAAEAVADASIVIVPTPWKEFAEVVASLPAGTTLADPRRAYGPDAVPAGVRYRSLGVQRGD